MTIIRPGMIVGQGGHGFGMVASNARRAVALGLAGGRPMTSIAIDDLTSYLISMLDDARSFGRCFDVGNDDVLTNIQMVDVVADVLGRRPPIKLSLPSWLLRTLAPSVERFAKLPAGFLSSLVQGVNEDTGVDPAPIREIAPRGLLSFRQAAERALGVFSSKAEDIAAPASVDRLRGVGNSPTKQALQRGV